MSLVSFLLGVALVFCSLHGCVYLVCVSFNGFTNQANVCGVMSTLFCVMAILFGLDCLRLGLHILMCGLPFRFCVRYMLYMFIYLFGL